MCVWRTDWSAVSFNSFEATFQNIGDEVESRSSAMVQKGKRILHWQDTEPNSQAGKICCNEGE